ncbi:hypothetical protein HIM_10929 [Hirsutella minnesotensis 3608]|uniref:Ndc10 domain-containing protein n=1 Tax=Hirsutella minnesotensis 3608 TaxID=1043627 RepID=A0A0F7ZWW5_9HYPO|nr:hypothetical protein HIM_10929 [Hirsutella minnesotensis 3608]
MARTPNRQRVKATNAGPRAKLAGGAAGPGAGAGAGARGRAKPSNIRQKAMNDAELRANAQTILSVIHESRPKTTTSAYAPKQEEFEQFCQRKQCCDGATVTEEKLLLFLVEEVAGRPLKVRSRKAASDTPQDETRLGTYVTAVTDLYRTHKALGMNTHPSPREDNVREYLKSLQRRDAQRDKESYADKGRDTLLDGCSEPEFERVCHELWAHSGTSTECHFRRSGLMSTAITDLYRTQKALGMNTHPSPREDNVREYLKSLQRRDAQRDKESYADKGRDTLLDGCSEPEFERVCHELWAHSGTSTECHFRTLVDLLFGHYLLTRGGDRRAAEISDLFTFEFAGEGSTRCMPLIFTTRAGKQNQHGRLETAGAYRNRNPLICILGGLSFYLLYRWDLGTEPFPDFSRRSSWYDIRLIKGNGAGRTAAFSYNSQRDWVVKAFAYAGITSQKKTHVGRSSGARTAELKGISEDQIRRAGRWNQEQMVGCYLNSLPRKFMRTMAGHPPQIGCFEIRRAGVAPPEILLSMIWPELDRWRGRFGPGTEQENDLAAMGSTNLLFYLREVVLQDSVVLMKK